MNQKSTFYTLFCVIIIDMMGAMLPMPILGMLIMSSHSPLLAADVTLHSRQLLYGVVASVFMLGMFIGSPILGDLSDHIGRKKGILACLFGVVGGNIISALSIISHSIWLLILGRFISGFAAGSQPIAQAAIIDISSDADRTINLSRIVLAVTLGIVLGPLIGGISGNTYFISLVGLSLPFWLSAGIAALNALALYTFYHETVIKKDRTPITFFSGFFSFVAAFKHSAIALLSIGCFLVQIAWSLYVNGIILYMYSDYHYSALKLGLFLAYSGLGASAGMTIGIRLMMRYLKTDKRSLLVAIIGMALTLFFVSIIHSSAGQWACIFLMSLFISVAYTNLLTLYSRHVTDTHQGWMMGVANSVATFAWVMTSAILGVLTSVSLRLPFAIGSCAVVVSLLLIRLYSRQPIEILK